MGVINEKNYLNNVYVDKFETATKRGTKIERGGNELDKNAFVKLLTAELSNQDPTNTQDPTAYVAQMAQFSSLEQMTNLNSTMTYMSASNMVGKNVTMGATNENGMPYSGIVTSVTKSGDNIKIKLNTSEREFSFNDIKNVDSTESIIAARNIIGKDITTNVFGEDGTQIIGKAVSVYNSEKGIMVKVENKDKKEYECLYKNVVGVLDSDNK